MMIPTDPVKRRLVLVASIAIGAAAVLGGLARILMPGDRPDTPPVPVVAEHAARVHYAGGGARAWGTLCRLPGGGFASVHHVTVNGRPVIGPRDAVTAFSEASDWSFLGVDPASIDPDTLPVLREGDRVTITGFPARARTGEVIPGRVYLRDPVPPYLWIELHDVPPEAPGLAAEGVVGGLSGSCVLDGAGDVAGVVHANGFSRIEDTTNTWALIVPLRDAVLEAQGTPPAAPVAMIGDPRRIPAPETGCRGLAGDTR